MSISNIRLTLLGFSVLIAGLSVTPALYASRSPVPSYYNDPGFSSYREQLQTETEIENIDPFAGRLNLQHVDVAIPGNGGMDLELVRSYSNNQIVSPTYPSINGVGWNLHLGRIALNPNNAVCGKSATTSAYNHVLEMPDGSMQLLYPGNTAPYSTFVSVTPQRWKAECASSGTGLIVTSPEGIRYEMTVASVSGSPYLMPSRIVDRNNNVITITYKLLTASGGYQTRVIDQITTSDGRAVQFGYANPSDATFLLTSITAGTAVWNYGYQKLTEFASPTYQLVSVTRPDGLRWLYSYYSAASPNNYSLRNITYPRDATATYTYQAVNFGNAAATYSVASKQVQTLAQSATWTYTFAPGSNYDLTTIKGPDATYRYAHFGYKASVANAQNISTTAWKIGVQLFKQVLDAAESRVYETTDMVWDKQLISNQNQARDGASGGANLYSYAPVLTQKTITRDGTTYRTQYSNFDAHGNARTVTETGTAGTRSTTLTYLSNTTKWLLRAVASQTISGIGEIKKTFDANGNVTALNRYGVTTNYTYAATGDVATQKDALSNTTSYASYKRGIAQAVTQPDGVKVQKVVNDRGTLASVTDGKGYVTSYTYNGVNQPLTIKYPVNASASLSWSKSSVTLTRGGFSETTSFDGLGRMTQINRGGISNLHSYDSLGRKKFESFACAAPSQSCGEGKSFQYDPLGRITQQSTDNQSVRSYEYQANGRVSIRTERGNYETRQSNAYGDPDDSWEVSVTTPTTATVITRNAIGLVTKITQGNFSRTFNYDSRFYLTSTVDPETGTTSYGYDAAGNVTSQSINGASTATFVYDKINRRTSATHTASGANLTAAPATTWIYDANSNITSMVSGCSSNTYQYNQRNNLTLEQHKDTCGGPTLQTTYTFNTLDHVASLTLPSGRVINYAPDVLGRPKTASAFVSAVSYLPSGMPQSITFGNNAVQQTTLTGRRYVGTRTGKNAQGVVLTGFNYDYDGANNVTRITDTVDAARTTSLAYDGDEQLTTANGIWGTGRFTYDATGNLTVFNVGSVNKNFQYDSSHRLSSVSINGVNTALSHDAHGNLINDGRYQYRHDTQNRLASLLALNGNAISSYQYDGMGALTRRTSGSETVYYFYGRGGQLLGEYTTAGAPLREPIYLGRTQVAVVNKPAGGTETITYTLTDPVGSPIAGIKPDGTLSWREHYYPYGDREVLTGNSSNDQWYTGKLQDQNSLLVNMGARQYHPLLGRFTSTDPVTPNADNGRTFNRYAYANNNPYKFTDPDGRSPIDIAFLVADTVKLASAIASGNPAAVTSAAVDVGLSILGVASPVPGAGQAIKAVRAADKVADGVAVAANVGRAGKQARLRELATDKNLGSADRGWLQQEINSIDRGQRSSIRNPPGKDLAHERGRESAKGYSYEHSNLQDRDLHKTQHKYDDFGRKNKERPLN